MEFVAIDFETANRDASSACALGLAIVKGGKITAKHHWLIRPPQDYFRADFTDIHGITAAAVRNCPSFKEIWPEVKPFLEGACLAAHNARFDRSVLQGSLEYYGLDLPAESFFVCTLELSRQTWKLPKNNLAAVASHLDLPLQHHQAESDALACAGILLRAADYWQCASMDALIDKTGLRRIF